MTNIFWKVSVMKTLLKRDSITSQSNFSKIHSCLILSEPCKKYTFFLTTLTGTQKEEELYVRLIDSQTKQVYMYSD